MTEPILRQGPEGGVPYRLNLDPSASGLPVLMLHGWSGDETVMWVLETVLPHPRLIAAPRGLYPLAAGGYQWADGAGGLNSSMKDFQEGVQAIRAVVDELAARDDLDPTMLVLMGFSQGAALSFALAQIGDLTPRGLISLAGFIPHGSLDRLRGIPVFWGHGNRDQLVPIGRARQDLDRLESAGGDITFCEADVGHRLGIECTRGLKRWIEQLS
jgi:phospholipase/carboxylesterase